MAGKNIEEADIGVARMAGPMFDVIVLPKGLVDVKFVVGRIRSGKVVDLDEAKIAQVQRDWGLERPAKHFRGNGEILRERLSSSPTSARRFEMTSRRPWKRANDS